MARVRKIPQRMCVGCRQMRPKREMVRIVRSPAGEIKVDPTGKAAGRGAYVDPMEDCVMRAFKERRLQHALEAEIPAGIIDAVKEMLTRPVTPPSPRVIRIPATAVPAAAPRRVRRARR